MSIQLSVNVNKIATLRNSRGGNIPNLLQYCKVILDEGAYGITVHPREDERHITTQDVFDIKKFIEDYNHKNKTQKEYNIEGELSKRFLSIVLKTQPTQITFVPVEPNEITSHKGFDLKKDKESLLFYISKVKEKIKSRISIFMETDVKNLKRLTEIPADRVELYTGPFAHSFEQSKEQAQLSFKEYQKSAQIIHDLGIELNAGHDLDLENLKIFKNLPYLKEVSIGHRLISHSLKVGLATTVQKYLNLLKN